MARGKKKEKMPDLNQEQFANQMQDAKDSVQDMVAGLKQLAGATVVSSEQFQDFLQSSKDLTRSLGKNKNLVEDIAKNETDINKATKQQ